MTDATTKVPNEILWACMDYLSLNDIVRLMGISKRWQQLAINHEKYWKYVTISSSSDAATQWFLLRLSRTRLRLITVDATLVGSNPDNLIAVLQAITGHLAYIQSLVFCVSYRHSGWLFDALCYPAYNLEQLTLRVDIDRIVPRVPSSLLMGMAPKLSRLATQNIHTRHVPTGVFPSLNQLEFGYSCNSEYELFDVQALLKTLGSVRNLTLTGCPYIDDPSIIDPSVFGALSRLTLRLDCAMPKNMRRLLAMHRIQHVVYTSANRDKNAVSALMYDMNGPLNIHVQQEECSDDAFSVHVVEPSTSRVRLFTFCDAPALCDILHTEISARIVGLSLPAHLWQTIMPFALSLPALTELRVLFPSGSDAAHIMGSSPVQKLHSPKLQKLTLRSGHPQPANALAPQMLTSFISRSLNSASFPIVVRLEGTRLSSTDGLAPDIVRLIEHGDASSEMLNCMPLDHVGVLM